MIVFNSTFAKPPLLNFPGGEFSGALDLGRVLGATIPPVTDWKAHAPACGGPGEQSANRLLGQAFSLGVQRRLIITAPHIRRLPEDNARQGFFEPAEFEAVVSNLPEYLKDFTRFAYITAWRKNQIASLLWADVDRDGGVIVARAAHVKNGKPHKIALEDGDGSEPSPDPRSLATPR